MTPTYTVTESKLRASWGNVESRFRATTEKIRTRVRRLKEKSKAIQASYMASTLNQAVLLQDLEKLETGFEQNMTMTGINQNVLTVVNNIPYPKNPNFYARENELNEIRMALDHKPNDIKFRSFALWGMGGIGKTQLALAYAHESEEKGIPAIFWINSETLIDIYQSYTAIAELLDLKDRVRDASGNQNQFLVTKWLQKTRKSFISDSRDSTLTSTRFEMVASI
jgi:DNA replication protein DnaC